MSRLSGPKRKRIFEQLSRRDGECCYIGQEPGSFSTLVIDHADNDNGNNRLANLHLVCRCMNSAKNPRGRSPKILSSVCVSDKVLGLESAQPSSAEFKKNMQAEPDFKHWLFMEIWRMARLPLEDVINSGAAHARCSQETIKRYLKKECSRLRPYQTTTDPETGAQYVHFNREWEEYRKREMDRRMDAHAVRKAQARLIKGVAVIEKDPRKKIDERVKRASPSEPLAQQHPADTAGPSQEHSGGCEKTSKTS